MKILMLGWEYPPQISGGLGIASQGLAESLTDAGNNVHFLLPKKTKSQVSKKVKLINASEIKPNFKLWIKEKEQIEILKDVEIGKLVQPYLPPQITRKEKISKKVTKTKGDHGESKILEQIKLTGTYSDNLLAELTKYALLTVQVAREKKFDVIHAHDWVTFKAGVMASQLTGIPLFVHVHSTEYERNGQFVQETIINEENYGFQNAHHIFCVSTRTKSIVCEKYQIDPSKVSVTPNAVHVGVPKKSTEKKGNHIAFVGRLTHQKNPQVIVDIARELTNKGYDYTYSIIGDGYLKQDLLESVRRYNLTDRFSFPGFLDRSELLKQYAKIDLLIAPSISEPFGLVVLEALLKHIPVVASSGVGIAEFIPSLPQVNSWDTFTFSRVAEELMNDKKFRISILKECTEEALEINWDKTLKKVLTIYQKYT